MTAILPSVIYLYPNNTQVINIVGLTDVTTGEYLNSATVSATLFDPRGNADPVLNNIDMGYIAASNGNYQGTVSYQFSPPGFTGQSKGGYLLQITAQQSGIQAVYSIPAIIELRSQQ